MRRKYCVLTQTSQCTNIPSISSQSIILHSFCLILCYTSKAREAGAEGGAQGGEEGDRERLSDLLLEETPAPAPTP